MPISTRNLSLMPDIGRLREICQAIAVLDAILMPEWEQRYYSFNSRWGDGEMMASMRNGEGDEYFIFFNKEGAIIKGFDHESTIRAYNDKKKSGYKGILDEVPVEFSPFLTEPAFGIDNTSFCLWKRYKDDEWKIGNINFPEGKDPDGSESLLYILEDNPQIYQQWAEEYYEREVPIDVVRKIYAHTPLTKEIILELNLKVEPEKLKKDLQEIGYPFDF